MLIERAGNDTVVATEQFMTTTRLTTVDVVWCGAGRSVVLEELGVQ